MISTSDPVCSNLLSLSSQFLLPTIGSTLPLSIELTVITPIFSVSIACLLLNKYIKPKGYKFALRLIMISTDHVRDVYQQGI